MNTYKWNFVSAEKMSFHDVEGRRLEDVIENVRFTIEVSDGEKVATYCSFDTLQTPDPAQFTPSEDVTSEQIMGWLRASLLAKPYIESPASGTVSIEGGRVTYHQRQADLVLAALEAPRKEVFVPKDLRPLPPGYLEDEAIAKEENQE